MFSYTQIIKTAYRMTVEHPVLWWFGLFVFGGFSLNFLHFQNIPVAEMRSRHNFWDTVVFLQSHPAILAALSGTVLLAALVGLFLTNWSRVVLILGSASVAERRGVQLAAQIRKSWRLVWRVIAVSLLTSFLVLTVAGIFLLAPWRWVQDPAALRLVWTLGSVMFLPLAFAISCINIFTIFYLVAFNLPVPKALNLGTDFFVVNWNKILGLTLVLMVIYAAGFMVGVAVIFLSGAFLDLLIIWLPGLGFFGFSAIMIFSKLLSTSLLWLLVAVLNVFINSSLLLLFLELSRPLQLSKKELKEIVVSPVPS